MKTSAALAIAAAFALALAGPAVAADVADGPVGDTVLVVAGDIDRTNRPPFDARRDAFLGYHETGFEKAFAFDRAMLESLGETEIGIEFHQWIAPKTFSGPRLADVLAAAGCVGKPLATLALDGFSTEIPAEEIAARDWVLATRSNGRPLDIGGRGPLWLVFDPPGDRPATDEEELMWPWALFFLRCG